MRLINAKPFALVVFSLWLAGCAATAYCPAHVEDPRPAFILGHGRHTTLVLADRGGHTLYRYGYGDWRYYAEANTGLWSGVRALAWPTPAAFGRQEYSVPAPTRRNVIRAVRAGIGDLHQIEVAGRAAEALQAELDRLHRQGAQVRLLVNEPYDFHFAQHPQKYWYWHNSNHKVAEWLEQLGCDVRGFAGHSIEIGHRNRALK